MKKILIIQNKRIGDVLHSSIIADNIKQIFPNSEIDFLTYDYCSGVIENHKNIDNIIRVSEKNLKKLTNLIKEALKIKKTNYDIIFDPYSKFQSKLICQLSKAEYRIGFQRKKKKTLLKPYNHAIGFLNSATQDCGKSIEDRVNLVASVFKLETAIYEPKIHLTKEELHYSKLEDVELPVIVFGIFGSNPKKSMPKDYIINLVNFVTGNYKVNVLFNYAPYQKEDAKDVYDGCQHKDQIIFDIYEENIRGFVCLMNSSKLLIANEGGAVHIAKALSKPTFTIYSPYILRESWASFEDGKTHTSVHLLDHKPELFEVDRDTRKKIESDPEKIYREFTPDLITPKLDAFLKHHISPTS